MNIGKKSITDQDDVISQQSDVIKSLRNCNVLMTSNDKGGEEHDIEECKLAMQHAKSNSSELARENTKLKEQMAYDAQVQVVDTKDQEIPRGNIHRENDQKTRFVENKI